MLLNILAAFLSGVAGAMGLGGGGVLVLYLTLYLKLNQLKSQGINLIFFIPCSIVALIMHTKNKLIAWKEIIPFIIGGIIGVTTGIIVIKYIETNLITKLFAALLIVMGIKEFFTKTNGDNPNKTVK